MQGEHYQENPHIVDVIEKTRENEGNPPRAGQTMQELDRIRVLGGGL